MRHLPVSWTSAIGAVIGELVARHAARSNNLWVTRFYKNIEKLKGISSAELLKKHLIEYGRQTGRLHAEYTVLKKINQQGYITIKGEKNIGDTNKPVIFISSHLSNWELTGKVLTLMDNPSNVLVLPIEGEDRARIVNEARLSWRKASSPIAPLISTDSPMAMKHLAKKLSAGENLLIFTDELRQDYVSAPSLGRDIPYAGNRWLVARLAVQQNVDVIPLCVQRSRKIDFTILIGKRISAPSGGDKNNKAKYIADQIDHKLDSWVRNKPEHWFMITMLDLDKDFPAPEGCEPL
jgi:lauroyl/myristoyl acyltransferase